MKVFEPLQEMMLKVRKLDQYHLHSFPSWHDVSFFSLVEIVDLEHKLGFWTKGDG